MKSEKILKKAMILSFRQYNECIERDMLQLKVMS